MTTFNLFKYSFTNSLNCFFSSSFILSSLDFNKVPKLSSKITMASRFIIFNDLSAFLSLNLANRLLRHCLTIFFDNI